MMFKRIIRWLVLAIMVSSNTSLAFSADPFPQLAYMHPLSDMTHCDQVTVSSLDGTLTQQFILPINNGCMQPVWSPNGQYLVVYHPGLMLIEVQTDDIQILNDLSAGMLSDTPVWSRDGKYLAWHEQRGGSGTDSSWKLLHITDMTVKTVSDLSEVSIWPDTMQFLYMEKDGLYTIGAGITPQVIYLPQTMDCASPVASFGLLFVCVEMNDLVLLDTLMMGGKSINLTNTPDLQESNAQLSPDKQQIVYQTYDPKTHKTWLNHVSKTGIDAAQLTTPMDDNYDVFPQWSPDGAYIAFQRHSGYKGLDAKVHVIKPDGSGLQYIGDGIYPAWRPIT